MKTKRMRMVALALALLITFALAACGGNTNDDNSTPSTSQSSDTVPPTQGETSAPEQSQDSSSSDYPLRISAYDLPNGKQNLNIYLDLPSTGDYSFDGYIGDSHITSQPFSDGADWAPEATLYDSSGATISQSYSGSIDSWGVIIQVQTSDYDWDFDSITTVTIDCTSDTGSTISGEFSLKDIFVEERAGDMWYMQLGGGNGNDGASPSPQTTDTPSTPSTSLIDITFPDIDNSLIPDVLKKAVGTFEDFRYWESDGEYKLNLIIGLYDVTDSDYEALQAHYATGASEIKTPGAGITEYHYDWGWIKLGDLSSNSVAIEAYIK